MSVAARASILTMLPTMLSAVHVVRLDEEDVLVDTPGSNVALVTHLDAAEP